MRCMWRIGRDLIAQNQETSIQIFIYNFKKFYQTVDSNLRPSASKETVLPTKPLRLYLLINFYFVLKLINK